MEVEAGGLIDALLEDIDSTGHSDTEVAERSATERAHISRIRSKQAHPPQSLVAWAVDNSRHRPPRYLVALNAVGGYEPKPLPPPDVAEVFAAYREEMDADYEAVVRARVEKRLGVVLSPSKRGEDAP